MHYDTWHTTSVISLVDFVVEEQLLEQFLDTVLVLGRPCGRFVTRNVK